MQGVLLIRGPLNTGVTVLVLDGHTSGSFLPCLQSLIFENMAEIMSGGSNMAETTQPMEVAA